MALRKSKAFALLSIIIAATALGALVLSVSASDDATNEEIAPADIRGFHNPPWLDTLTDEQRETLKQMIEENHAEIKNQLEEWNVTISELNDEQREILKTMHEENRAEVEAQLEEWGIEIPTRPEPMGWQNTLTEELHTMRQEYLDSVKAKLEEWGIEAPEPNDGMGFHERDARGFGLLKP